MTCDRCHKQTYIHTMSMFNTDTICMECKTAERKRPDYKAAYDANNEAIRQGNYKFRGIGL